MRPEVRLEILIAVVVAIVVILISPGYAATGAIALIVLIACAVSVPIARRVRRSRPTARAMVRPGGRSAIGGPAAAGPRTAPAGSPRLDLRAGSTRKRPPDFERRPPAPGRRSSRAPRPLAHDTDPAAGAGPPPRVRVVKARAQRPDGPAQRPDGPAQRPRNPQPPWLEGLDEWQDRPSPPSSSAR